MVPGSTVHISSKGLFWGLRKKTDNKKRPQSPLAVNLLRLPQLWELLKEENVPSKVEKPLSLER